MWGVAWHIDPKKSHEVRRYLDHREQNGYTAQSVNVYRKDENGEEVVALTDVLIYVGLPDNEAFVGPSKSLKDLAEYIFTCEGPRLVYEVALPLHDCSHDFVQRTQ